MNKTVHSPLFFQKIVEILRVLPLMAAILIFKCTEEAGVGDYSSRWRETNFFFFPPPKPSPPPKQIRHSSKMASRNRTLQSQRSYGKIGDCEQLLPNCWFSHDVTKIQTKKLSILPGFYFYDALEQLKANFHPSFRFKRVLGFVIEYACIPKLLRDAAFTWRPKELSWRLKKWLISGNFAI